MNLRLHNQTFTEALHTLTSHGPDQVRVSRSDNQTIRATTLFERVQMRWDTLRGKATDAGARSADVKNLLIDKLTAELTVSALLYGEPEAYVSQETVDAFRMSAAGFLNELEKATPGPLGEIAVGKHLHQFQKSMHGTSTSKEPSLVAKAFAGHGRLQGLMIHTGQGKKFLKSSINEFLKPVKSASASAIPLEQGRNEVHHQAVARNALWVQKKFGLNDQRAYWYGAQMTRLEPKKIEQQAGFDAVCFAVEQQRQQYELLKGKDKQKIISEQDVAQLNQTFESSLTDYVNKRTQLIEVKKNYEEIKRCYPETKNKRVLAKIMADPQVNTDSFRSLNLADKIDVAKKFNDVKNEAKKNQSANAESVMTQKLEETIKQKREENPVPPALPEWLPDSYLYDDY